MECAQTFSYWFAVGLNLIAGGLMGYWCSRVRHIRREEREIAAMRARAEQNLVRSTLLLQQMQAFAGDDDDALSRLQ